MLLRRSGEHSTTQNFNLNWCWCCCFSLMVLSWKCLIISRLPRTQSSSQPHLHTHYAEESDVFCVCVSVIVLWLCHPCGTVIAWQHDSVNRIFPLYSLQAINMVTAMAFPLSKLSALGCCCVCVRECESIVIENVCSTIFMCVFAFVPLKHCDIV